MALEAQNNPFTSILMVEAADPEALPDADPSAGQRRLAVGTDHLLYLVDDSGVKHAVGSTPTTLITTDTAWAAKGDLIVGSANDTAVIKTVGANDTILMADSSATGGVKWVASQTPSTQAFSDAAAEGTADTYARGDHKHAMPANPGGGGLSSGTSNPGSPSDGDLFYRSDLDLIVRYRSSGTRWVCTCLHHIASSGPVAVNPTGTLASLYIVFPNDITTNIYLERWRLVVVVNTTNNGSNYWTFTNALTTNTSADAAATVLIKDTSPGSVIDISAANALQQIDYAKVGSPGTVYLWAVATFRYIVT